MMEKKKEAEEWKSKYEMLVSTVADSSNATGDYKALEIAADLEGKGGVSELELDRSVAAASISRHPWQDAQRWASRLVITLWSKVAGR